jgi:hypothetical protein
MARRKLRPGDFIRIPLSDGTFAHARLTPQDSYLEFGAMRVRSLPSLQELARGSFRTFPLLVTLRPIHEGRWAVIGNIPWREEFAGQHFLVGDMIEIGTKTNEQGFIDPSSELRPATSAELQVTPKMRLANEEYLVSLLEAELPVEDERVN